MDAPHEVTVTLPVEHANFVLKALNHITWQGPADKRMCADVEEALIGGEVRPVGADVTKEVIDRLAIQDLLEAAGKGDEHATAKLAELREALSADLSADSPQVGQDPT